jgi:tol-pal system protein YbgF
VTETFQAEEKILPQDLSPEKQYEFATSFLKVGDYSTAERAFREFVLSNSKHELAGSAQYWYAETFRIRQLYTDAASAYLEGYQKYPKGTKAPINLLKLGVSMVQIGEKDQGCKMINGVELQYPKANQSVIQKAKYESKKFECIKEDS